LELQLPFDCNGDARQEIEAGCARGQPSAADRDARWLARRRVASALALCMASGTRAAVTFDRE